MGQEQGFDFMYVPQERFWAPPLQSGIFRRFFFFKKGEVCMCIASHSLLNNVAASSHAKMTFYTRVHSY